MSPHVYTAVLVDEEAARAAAGPIAPDWFRAEILLLPFGAVSWHCLRSPATAPPSHGASGACGTKAVSDCLWERSGRLRGATVYMNAEISPLEAVIGFMGSHRVSTVYEKELNIRDVYWIELYKLLELYPERQSLVRGQAVSETTQRDSG